MNDDSLDPAFLSLVQQFVERQSVVLEAMEEVCPRRLFSWRHTGDKLAKDQPQFGMWRDEWKYFWHGAGCALKNLKTGEPLEWDAPDLQAFDRHWLANWFKWRISQENQDENTAIVRSAAEPSTDDIEAFVYARLDHLRETGVLVQGSSLNSNKLTRAE
ncbi:MAG: hypothetical protein ABI700_19280 [Chloroflexota bacterium]